MNIRLILSFFFLFCLINSAMAERRTYSVLDRYKLQEDRFKTQDMLRPYEHDFFTNIGAAYTTDTLDLIDSAKKVSKTTGGSIAKLEAAEKFLEKYNDTEHLVRGIVEFGIPFFTFKAFGVKIVPDIRFGANFGTMIGIITDDTALTADTLMEFVPTKVPAELRDAIAARFDSYGAGDDLIDDNVCNSAKVQPTECAALKGKYFFPDVTIPSLQGFAKFDAYAGVVFNFSKDNFFGYVNPKVTLRGDHYERLGADYFARNTKIAGSEDFRDFLNLNFDLKFGYAKDDWSVFTTIEEIKVAELDNSLLLDGKNKTEPDFGTDPLIRLHGEYEFDLLFLKLVPFAGVHKRKGYDFNDGIYLGADVGYSFWSSRLGMLVSTVVDSEYITLTPRIKLIFLQAEFYGKFPHKSKVDKVKVPVIYGANIRLFF